MREIELSQGLVALVDDEDYLWLSQWKWTASRSTNTWYVLRKTPRPERKVIYIHRQIMEAPDGLEVDHRNENGLDNQRSNLRLATHSQNKQNRGPQKNNTSGHKGVTWDKQNQRWRAQIKIGSKVRYLGLFDSPEDAGEAYRSAALENQGDFAWRGLVDATRVGV